MQIKERNGIFIMQQSKKLETIRTDYKNGIIEALDHISDSDSVFLRQILIILLRHVQKKGGVCNE